MITHPGEDVLASYASRSEVLEERDEIEVHLRECDECRATLAGIREFEKALASEETWQASALNRAMPALSPAVEHTRALADIEDQTAEYLLSPVLGDSTVFGRSGVVEDARFVFAGVVRRLTLASAAARERDAAFALTLANAAILIAEQLGEPRYPQAVIDSLRGHAWRERANALRYTGDGESALAATDHAEAAFRHTPAPAFDLTRLDYVRATALTALGRNDEALALASAARRSFGQFGDYRRALHAGLLQACIHFDRRQYGEALTLFRLLLVEAESAADDAVMGRIHNGIAACHQELGELPLAAPHYQQALAFFDHYELPIEKTRTEWSLALLTARQGKRAEAIARLRKVAAAFTSLGCFADGGLVALDLVEQLLEAGELAEVRTLARELAERFRHLGMIGSADAAMQFLYDAVARDAASVPRAVEHLRHYFRSAASTPNLPFAGPPARP